MSDFTNICVDVETLSTRPDAVIVAIGAVKFNFNNDKTETFKVNINPRDGKRLGLHISKDTLDWWRKQKPEAINAWQHSQIDLEDALAQFSAFCGEANYIKFWSNGTHFDYPILESSYNAIGKVAPWRYWNVHELRTAYLLGGLDVNTEDRVGTYHDAVDDCLTEIKWLKKAVGQHD